MEKFDKTVLLFPVRDPIFQDDNTPELDEVLREVIRYEILLRDGAQMIRIPT